MEGTSHETSTDPAGTQTLLADVGSDLKDNSDDDSLKCKVCNKCYKQKPSVIKHMINIHGIENLEKKKTCVINVENVLIVTKKLGHHKRETKCSKSSLLFYNKYNKYN